MRTHLGVIWFALALVGASSGCSLPLVGRWYAKPAVVQPVPADPDSVWQQVAAAVDQLGWTAAAVHPSDRFVTLTWVTTPGDGRAYLRCAGSGTVGSASLQPRIRVRPAAQGSVVEISAIARATVGSDCVSTGLYERWLYDQLVSSIQIHEATPDGSAP